MKIRSPNFSALETNHFVAGLLTIFLGLIFITFILGHLSNISYPFSLENGEGIISAYAQILKSGRTLYQPIDAEPPLVGCNYPPLFIGLLALFDVRWPNLFSVGRSISMFSVILISIFVYMLCRQLSVNRIYCLVGVLGFYLSPYIYHFTIYSRPHVVSLFFGISGFYLLIYNAGYSTYRCTGSVLREIAGLFILTLATLTKQTAICPITGYFAWKILSCPRQAIQSLSIFGVMLLATHGTLNVFTGGNYFLWLFNYSTGTYSFSRFLSYSTSFLIDHPFLAFLNIIFIGYLIFGSLQNRQKSVANINDRGVIFPWLKPSEKEFLFFIYYFIVILSCALVSRDGSSIAYYFEMIVVGSVCGGYCLEKIIIQLHKTITQTVAVLLVTGFVFMQFAKTNGAFWIEPPLRYSESVANRDRALGGLFEILDGYLLSENTAYCLISGKEPYIVNPFIYANLSKRNLWHADSVIVDLSIKTIKLVCLNSDVNKPDTITQSRFDDDVLRTISAAFPYQIKFGNRYLYFNSKNHFDIAAVFLRKK